MNLKGLIFKSDDEDKKPSKKEETIKFPQKENSPAMAEEKEEVNEPFFPDFPTDNPVFEGESVETDNVPLSCQPHIDKVIKMYEDGFAKLNQQGYDFYEFFQAVVVAGINKSDAYKMAFLMGKGMLPTLTPETLVNQSQFYLDEINKVYNHYLSQGKKHETKLLTQKGQEESSLRSDVSRLEQEIAQKQRELRQAKDTLSGIDNRYKTQIEDLACKAQANQIAHDKLVGKIETVVQGIGNNVKS